MGTDKVARAALRADAVVCMWYVVCVVAEWNCRLLVLPLLHREISIKKVFLWRRCTNALLHAGLLQASARAALVNFEMEQSSRKLAAQTNRMIALEMQANAAYPFWTIPTPSPAIGRLKRIALSAFTGAAEGRERDRAAEDAQRSRARQARGDGVGRDACRSGDCRTTCEERSKPRGGRAPLSTTEYRRVPNPVCAFW